MEIHTGLDKSWCQQFWYKYGECLQGGIDRGKQTIVAWKREAADTWVAKVREFELSLDVRLDRSVLAPTLGLKGRNACDNSLRQILRR